MDDPVEILKALTHDHEPHDYEQGCCDWCGEPVANRGRRHRPHKPICPWRRAVTFLASQPESTEVYERCIVCGKALNSESDVDEHYAESKKRGTHHY